MARLELPPSINLKDPRTWVSPVDVRDTVHTVTKVRMYRAEYTIPGTPNAIEMALAQLPPFVPRDLPAYMRFYDTKANPRRDGRNKGGFAIEVTWPASDIFKGMDEVLEALDDEVSAKKRHKRKA